MSAPTKGVLGDFEAERALLGGILLHNAAILDVQDIARVDDFGAVRHQVIWEGMLALSARDFAIDLLTLADELRARGTFEASGGLGYLAALDANTPSTGNLEHYARIIREKSSRRRLLGVAHAIAALAKDDTKPIAESLAEAERLAVAAANDVMANGEVETIAAELVEFYKELERRTETKNPITGTPTGFNELDLMTAGLHAGDLIVLAARPSMGKTSLVMNLASRVAIDRDQPVVVFSLEQPTAQIVERLILAESRVDSTRARGGRLTNADWNAIAQASNRAHKAKIVVRDELNTSVLDMRSIARRAKKKFGGLGLVIVDYLQLMQTGSDGGNREQEVAALSRGLKALARELECPVIALSQLNRGLERREDKRPMMSDLRESGAIEQDADLVLFLYRDEVYHPKTDNKGIAEIIIGKQRNGPTGIVKVAWRKQFMRFDPLDAEGNEEPPQTRIGW